MSLFKQIQAFVMVLLLTMLAIVIKIDFDNARELAVRQLFTNSKNTANILALLLGSQAPDEGLMQTSINAMFDGGYYWDIRLIRQDGSVVHERHDAAVVIRAPRLFQAYVDLGRTTAEAQVLAGWTLFGSIRVTGNPAPYYNQLWVTFQQLLVLFVLLGSGAVAISHVLLRYLFKSLERIKQQAEAVSNNEFLVNDDIPRAPELRKVVLAMNAMVEKVQTIYQRQLENLKQYEESQFKDPDTGLYNRRYLIKRLRHCLENDTGLANGLVVILGITGLDDIHVSKGHPVIHRFCRDMATILQDNIVGQADAIAVRLPQQEFALVLPGSEEKEGAELVRTIIRGFEVLIAQTDILEKTAQVYAGIAGYRYGDDPGRVLSKADYALSVAKSGIAGSVELFRQENDHVVLGKFEWRTMIEAALEEQRFLLTAQPVLSEAGEVHREVFLILEDSDGLHLRAGRFMPMVMALGMASRLDRYVIEQAVHLAKNDNRKVLAVNVTSDLLHDQIGLLWLKRMLKECSRQVSRQLVFEIHENTLIHQTAVCLDFVEMLAGRGFGYGLDRYTMNAEALGLVKDMKPHYIKIERYYLQDEENASHTDIALNSLITIADSLDIRLVATKVETEQQRKRLLAKHITCFQGQGIAGITSLGAPR
jgi:diguanylate cyclase (GGDEF)-like protein